MTRTFDTATLEALRTTMEVGIRTSANTKRPVAIWIVVVDDAVFVRSFRGARGKWYLAATADRQAILELGDRALPVRVETVMDHVTIEAVSLAFLAKYAVSPYVQAMVSPSTLMTTLRLEPG